MSGWSSKVPPECGGKGRTIDGLGEKKWNDQLVAPVFCKDVGNTSAIDFVERYQALQGDMMAVPMVRDSHALARFGFHYNQLEIPTRDTVVKGGIGGSYVLTVAVVVGMGDCPRHILPFVS